MSRSSQVSQPVSQEGNHPDEIVVYQLTDYKVTLCGMPLLMVSLVAVICFVCFGISTARMTMLALTAMTCSLAFGYGIAALLTPLDKTEQGRFPRLLTALGGVVSGFTLGKAGEIITFLSDRLPPAHDDFVDTMFLLLGPLATFLIGLISGFVLRTFQVDWQENQQRARRLAAERSNLHASASPV
jgi:hypothetical protein